MAADVDNLAGSSSASLPAAEPTRLQPSSSVANKTGRVSRYRSTRRAEQHQRQEQQLHLHNLLSSHRPPVPAIPSTPAMPKVNHLAESAVAPMAPPTSHPQNYPSPTMTVASASTGTPPHRAKSMARYRPRAGTINTAIAPIRTTSSNPPSSPPPNMPIPPIPSQHSRVPSSPLSTASNTSLSASVTGGSSDGHGNPRLGYHARSSSLNARRDIAVFAASALPPPPKPAVAPPRMFAAASTSGNAMERPWTAGGVGLGGAGRDWEAAERLEKLAKVRRQLEENERRERERALEERRRLESDAAERRAERELEERERRERAEQAERVEQERLERARTERERLEKERVQREMQMAREQEERERAERNRAERERERALAEQEHAAQENVRGGRHPHGASLRHHHDREPVLQAPELPSSRRRKTAESDEFCSSQRPHRNQPDTPTSPSFKERIGFLRRLRGDDAPKSPPSPEDLRPRTNPGHAPPPPLSSNEPVPTIRPGGGGIVPGFDAPVSAVNHGGRHVRIAANGSSTLIPIQPDTTSLQVIRTACTCLPSARLINPRSSVLFEHFTKGGVMRQLRMYEHIRDVLNSWDSDDQHTLELREVDEPDSSLYAALTPTSKPSGGSWWFHTSQRPGKWEKRYISLRADGQLVAAKNESGKDSANVCHLSDFDVYSVTQEARKKSVRPPKKHCLATKSMQKSSVFLNTTMFIAFFCTNDEVTAKSFNEAVHRWRSWYLVNVMGEGNAKSASHQMLSSPSKDTGIMNMAINNNSAPLLSQFPSHKPSVKQQQNGYHSRNVSRESTYLLGSFNTALDFDPNAFALQDPSHDPRRNSQHRSGFGSHNRNSYDTPLANIVAPPNTRHHLNGVPSAVEHSRLLHERKMQIRSNSRGAPPVSYLGGHHQVPQQRRDPPTPRTPSSGTIPFNEPAMGIGGVPSNGLHRNASTRSSRSTRSNVLYDAAATGGNGSGAPGLPHHRLPPTSSGPLQSTSNSVSRPSVDARRVPAHHDAPRHAHTAGARPLVDLTPQYQAPPQFQRRGRGVRPQGGGLLVESATGRQIAPGARMLDVPESRDWRAGRGVAGYGGATQGGGPYGGGLVGGGYATGGYASGAGGLVDTIEGVRGADEGFTGGGLLAAVRR